MLRRRPLRMHIALIPVINWCHLKRKASTELPNRPALSLFYLYIL